MMPLFQAQLKKGTKTITENVEANDYKDVLEYYYKLSTCEVLEIREWLYQSKSIKKDDGDYIKYVSCLVKDNNGDNYSFKLPKVNKNLTDNELEQLIFSCIEINGKKPTSLLITQNN